MAYTPTQWVNGQPPALNAENLNKIEAGLQNNDVEITSIKADLGELKSDLAECEIVTSVDFSNAINGGYINSIGNIASSDLFSYVTNIAVPKGYKIVFTARGYSTDVAMIARYANNAYIPLVASIDSTVRQYEYVAAEDIVIALSYNNAHTHSCKLLYEVETHVSAIVDSVQKDLTFTYINDYYVYSNGTIVPNESFYYTSPVYIEKGVTLHVFARGYSTNVAIISKTNSANTIHTPIVISEDSLAKWYEVDITESGYYCFCSSKAVPISAYAKIKVGFEDGLEERVRSLEENEIFDLSMFINFGVVGDSYASGEVYYDGGLHDKYENSWGQIMARQSGTNCTNYSAGGLTTKTWLTSSDGLLKVLANDAEDIYYLLLGINDRGYYGESYIGTLNDITDYQSYTDYADSFFGNYGRIIEQIQNHAPYAKLVLFTGTNTSELGLKYNNATIAIANYYGIPCIVQNDDAFFQTPYYADMVNGHPRTVAYSGMAQAFKRLIVKCIADNWDYFKDYYMHA